MKKPLYLITGVTATGKTRLALNLARAVGGELVSVDARQIYKHLDIVTGKDKGNAAFHTVEETPNKHAVGFYEIEKVPVWLYDIITPENYFSAFDYACCAQLALSKIVKNNHVPLIVGGTYFYIKSLLEPFLPGESPDWKRRVVYEQMAISELQKKLISLNIAVFEKLNKSDKKNKRRLIRWIEKSERKENSTPLAGASLLNDYDITTIGLCFSEKEQLSNALTKRVYERIKQGAIDEAQLLMRMGYTTNDPGLNSIGYKQIFAYLAGEKTHAEMIEEWITKERQYAKRQYTFMKKDPQIKWFYVDKMSLQEIVSKIYLIS